LPSSETQLRSKPAGALFSDGRHLCTPKFHIEPAPGSAAASYRSQAARRAARSSRVTLGDLAGLPLLMNAPCPHCEQISTRGSDAGGGSADMPAVGADDSGEHERDYRRSGRGRKRSSLAQQLRQLGFQSGLCGLSR